MLSTPEHDRSSPKKGRRAPTATVLTDPAYEDVGGLEDLGIKSHSERDGNDPPPKPPRRKTGGWGDASSKNAKGRAVSLTNDDANDSENETNNDKDINTIPDLDDFQEEENASQVAKAPSVAVNRVVTYKELDGDLLKQSTFTTLDDINLKVLSKFISPESEIQEDETLWTWDTLLADVSSKLNMEALHQEESDK